MALYKKWQRKNKQIAKVIFVFKKMFCIFLVMKNVIGSRYSNDDYVVINYGFIGKSFLP